MKRKYKITLIVLAVCAVIGLVVLNSLINYGMHYMASPETENMPLPGDNLLAKDDQILVFTKEIVIDAPPAKVWPWLAQMGQKEGGFYSFELLERIFTFDIHNTYVIKPEWQEFKTGEWIHYHQWGIGSEVMEVVKDKYFTMLSDSRRPPVNKGNAFALNAIPFGEFAWTWNFVLVEMPEGKTKLIQRCHNYFSPDNFLTRGYVKLFLGVPSIFMTTKQMEIIKACAEGRVDVEGNVKE